MWARTVCFAALQQTLQAKDDYKSVFDFQSVYENIICILLITFSQDKPLIDWNKNVYGKKVTHSPTCRQYLLLYT